MLNEATSALDDATEKAVMQAIYLLGKDITVLMVAHRTTTLRGCDRIFELKNGSLLREGSYEEVICVRSRSKAGVPGDANGLDALAVEVNVPSTCDVSITV